MRKFFSSLILMLCMFASVPAMAAETNNGVGLWFEGQVISNGLSSVICYYEKSLTDSFGFYVLVEKESNGYYEFYAGPKWKPLEWLEVGVGVGMENMPNSTRWNFFFDANWEKVGVSGSFENGGSGAWHKVTATYAVSKHIGVGVMDETGFEPGPRLEYNIKKNVQVWGALLRNQDTKENTSVFAINFSF